MKNPQISIIIPVYKAEKYLRQCLDSVKSQTFTDWECLLVDDGSPDNSGEICDEYAVLDHRFRVFHKENGGVSSARNLGIEKSIGDWIFFSDADDELMPDCLEYLFSCASKGEYDIIMAGNTREDVNGNLIDKLPPIIEEELDSTTALWLMYRRRYFYSETYLWDKLFRKSAIIKAGVCFNNEIKIKEDCLFIVQLLCKSKKAVFYSTHIVYRYKRNDDSVMSRLRSSYSPKQISIFEAHLLQIEAIKKSKISRLLTLQAIASAYRSICNIKSMMLKSNCYDKYVVRKLKQELFQQIGFFNLIVAIIYANSSKLFKCVYNNSPVKTSLSV